MASTSGGKEPPDIGANDGNEMEINYVPSPGGFVTLSEDRLSSSSDTDSQVLVSYHDFTLAQAKKRKVSVKNKEHQSKRVQITSCENVVDISNSQSSYTIPLGQREKQSVLSGITDSLVSSDKSPPQTVPHVVQDHTACAVNNARPDTAHPDNVVPHPGHEAILSKHI
ncbi:hypothetical protein ACJJTC_014258 [Scirpophaga incertulas]